MALEGNQIEPGGMEKETQGAGNKSDRAGKGRREAEGRALAGI